MRQRDIVMSMDNKELLEWMAYDMACDKDFRDKTYKEIDLEQQRKYTAEQEAIRLMNFFKGMGNG